MIPEALRRHAGAAVVCFGLGIVAWSSLISPGPLVRGRPNNVALTVHVAAVLVVGVVGAAVAATAADASRRHGLGPLERSSLRSRLEVVGRAVAPPAFALISGVALIYGMATARAQIESGGEHASLGLLAATLGMNVLQVTIGTACGLLLHAYAGAVVAVLLCYAAPFLGFFYGNSVAERLFPVIQAKWDPVLAPIEPRLLLAAAWLAALAGLVWFILLARRPFVRLVSAFVACACLGAPLVALEAQDGHVFARLRDSQSAHSCSAIGEAQVCLYSQDNSLLPVVTEGVNVATAVLAPTWSPPKFVGQVGLIPAESPGAVSLPLDRSAVTSGEVAMQLIRRSWFVQSPTCSALLTADGSALWEDVGLAVFARRAPALSEYALPGNRKVEIIAGLDRADQDRWLDNAGHSLARCQTPRSP